MKLLRKILFPFALLYGSVVYIRNFLFDRGFLSSKSYQLPVICVGNISVGGTGKSPMIEYLIHLLQGKMKVATLSRGYKRKTKGFQLVSARALSSEVGDEPLQFKTKFPDVLVTVDEDRQHGIAKLLNFKFPPKVILLDDAFQHRKVKAGLNILLTSYADLYSQDFLLPMGNLRESRKGAKRADIVVVTKCPPSLSEEERQRIQQQLKLEKHQKIYFTKIVYNEKVLGAGFSKKVSDLSSFTLITGIANPKPLVSHLKNLGLSFRHIAFPDHHHFTPKELTTLRKNPVLVTTEKDYMRLKGELKSLNLYYLPIGIQFLVENEQFEKQIMDFVAHFD